MLRLRVGSSNRVLLGVCGAGGVVVALAWSEDHWSWLVLWYAILLVTQGLRIRTEVHLCQPESGLPLDTRVRWAGISALASGLAQAASLAFFVLEDPFEQSLHTLILLVMSTGAVVYTAGHARTYYPFMAPIVGGLMLAWWQLSVVGDERPWLAVGFGALILVYGFNLVGYARDTWSMFLNAAAMRHQEALQSQRLAVAVRTAEAASHAKTRFLAAASHDLRQPIHTIALLTGVLKLRHQEGASAEAVTLLDSVVQSLSHQLDDLLDISKLDAGIVNVAAQPLSLTRFLRRRVDEVRGDALAKGLAVRMDARVDVTTYTDPNLLERVIRNLLGNAVKFTEKGEIVVELVVQGSQAVVRIGDTGCGIPPSMQAEVFHEFVQLDNPERDRNKGMGLGLSIVDRLCRLMDVGLHLTSVPGQGTVFELRLPLYDEVLPLRDALRPPALNSRRFGLVVLVVDDDIQVRNAAALLLEELGCSCLEAECLASALAATSNATPDFALVDYRLRGGEDGISVVQALRERHPGLQAVIVSGDIGAAQLQAIELAHLPLLHKPVQLDTLVDLLTRVPGARGHTTVADMAP